MENNTNLNDNVDKLFHSLENFTQKEGLMGKIVTQGDKTFIPVVSITLGYGSGNTAGKSPQPNMGTSAGNMSGGAQGLGAKICTDAIILIDKGNVSVMPINATTNPGQLVDKIPQILSGMNQNKQQQPQNQA